MAKSGSISFAQEMLHGLNLKSSYIYNYLTLVVSILSIAKTLRAKV
jgi:hypothetical protein|tara:strand:- start:1008 stop:1145 length:138 start_codon:yes stop_codon:yes gene_type:complete